MPIECLKFEQKPEKGLEKEPQEIERRFCIEDLPKRLERYPKKEITQGYVDTKDDSEVRIRRETKGVGGKEVNQYYKTEKRGHGMIREEKPPKQITKEEFDAIWPKTDGKGMEKTRYEIKYRGHTVELNVFKGELEGLKTVEVEFGSKEKSEKFKPPKWFGREVTEDERFESKNLASRGLPEEIREK